MLFIFEEDDGLYARVTLVVLILTASSLLFILWTAVQAGRQPVSSAA